MERGALVRPLVSWLGVNRLLEVAAVAGGGLGDVADALRGDDEAVPAAAAPAPVSAAAPDAAVLALDMPAPPSSAHEPPPRGAASGSVAFSFGIDFGSAPGDGRRTPPGDHAAAAAAIAAAAPSVLDSSAPPPSAHVPPPRGAASDAIEVSFDLDDALGGADDPLFAGFFDGSIDSDGQYFSSPDSDASYGCSCAHDRVHVHVARAAPPPPPACPPP